jgi:hypothetical protein
LLELDELVSLSDRREAKNGERENGDRERIEGTYARRAWEKQRRSERSAVDEQQAGTADSEQCSAEPTAPERDQAKAHMATA